MKRILLIVLIACAASACKKTAISPGLVGKWELRHEMGSIVGFDSTFKAGNGRILKFNSDSSFQQYNNSKLITQGKFHIHKASYEMGSPQSITFNDSGYESAYILNGDKLQIGADFDDGVETDYQKISD
jgi:hypothetical protein